MNKVLIFDSSGAYSRYFKINMPEVSTINFFKVDPSTIEFNTLDAAIVLVNELEELIDLLWLCNNAPIVFVGSYTKYCNTKYIKGKFRKFSNVVQLDLNSPKSKILQSIRFYMEAPPEEKEYFVYRSTLLH